MAWHHERHAVLVIAFFGRDRSGHSDGFGCSDWSGHGDGLAVCIASENVASKLTKTVAERLLLISRDDDRRLDHRRECTKLYAIFELRGSRYCGLFDTVCRSQRSRKPEE